MSGTKAGARKSVQKILELYGKDFYRETGRKGGSKLGVVKGFALMSKEKHKECSRKGGKISKRGKAKVHDNRSYES